MTSKSTIREYLYKDGCPGGERFSMILMDDFGGEIRAVAFDFQVSEFYEKFEVRINFVKLVDHDLPSLFLRLTNRITYGMPMCRSKTRSTDMLRTTTR